MKAMMKYAAPVAAAFALSACGSYEAVEEVRAIEPAPQNAQFLGYLAEGYRDLAIYEADEMVDWQSGPIFAQKALLAADGTLPRIENPTEDDWDLTDARRSELTEGYSRLNAALQAGARERFPAEAAMAQVKFDCWIEQAEEGHQYDHIASCRDNFIFAVEALEQPAEPVATTPPPVLVFFDWDQADLEREAVPIMNQLADGLQNNPEWPVRIRGYADTSGPVDYNIALSMRRAETVRDALVERGVDPDRMELIALGETELRVPTADGVREPQNRRVRVETLQPAMAAR